VTVSVVSVVPVVSVVSVVSVVVVFVVVVAVARRGQGGVEPLPARGCSDELDVGAGRGGRDGQGGGRLGRERREENEPRREKKETSQTPSKKKGKQTFSSSPLTSPSGTSSSEFVVSTVLRSKVASRVQSTASPSSGPLMETL
jgi:hypothetical protein